MNCKTGDLAVVVRGKSRGALVSVLEPSLMFVDAWVVRLHCWGMTNLRVVGKGDLANCYDANLRPIRDPGEDAQDESLSWLPVPSTDKAPA